MLIVVLSIFLVEGRDFKDFRGLRDLRVFRVFRDFRDFRDFRVFRVFRVFIPGFSVAALFAAQGRHALRKAAILTEVLGQSLQLPVQQEAESAPE